MSYVVLRSGQNTHKMKYDMQYHNGQHINNNFTEINNAILKYNFEYAGSVPKVNVKRLNELWYLYIDTSSWYNVEKLNALVTLQKGQTRVNKQTNKQRARN